MKIPPWTPSGQTASVVRARSGRGAVTYTLTRPDNVPIKPAWNDDKRRWKCVWDRYGELRVPSTLAC